MLWTTWLLTGEMTRTTETERKNMERSDREGRDHMTTREIVIVVGGVVVLATVLVTCWLCGIPLH